MRTAPFDPEMLAAYAYFSSRYPDLTLDGFRELWHEAGAFMEDALQLGYSPSDVPHLLRTGPYPISD